MQLLVTNRYSTLTIRILNTYRTSYYCNYISSDYYLFIFNTINLLVFINNFFQSILDLHLSRYRIVRIDVVHWYRYCSLNKSKHMGKVCNLVKVFSTLEYTFYIIKTVFKTSPSFGIYKVLLLAPL